MKQAPFLLSLLLLLASGSVDGIKARTSLLPAGQTEQPAAGVPAQTGLGTAAIIAGAVAVVAIAGYFLLRKKPPTP